MSNEWRDIEGNIVNELTQLFIKYDDYIFQCMDDGIYNFKSFTIDIIVRLLEDSYGREISISYIKDITSELENTLEVMTESKDKELINMMLNEINKDFLKKKQVNPMLN